MRVVHNDSSVNGITSRSEHSAPLCLEWDRYWPYFQGGLIFAPEWFLGLFYMTIILNILVIWVHTKVDNQWQHNWNSVNDSFGKQFCFWFMRVRYAQLVALEDLNGRHQNWCQCLLCSLLSNHQISWLLAIKMHLKCLVKLDGPMATITFMQFLKILFIDWLIFLLQNS